jgi:hypothetical protein
MALVSREKVCQQPARRATNFSLTRLPSPSPRPPPAQRLAAELGLESAELRLDGDGDSECVLCEPSPTALSIPLTFLSHSARPLCAARTHSPRAALSTLACGPLHLGVRVLAPPQPLHRLCRGLSRRRRSLASRLALFPLAVKLGGSVTAMAAVERAMALMTMAVVAAVVAAAQVVAAAMGLLPRRSPSSWTLYNGSRESSLLQARAQTA